MCKPDQEKTEAFFRWCETWQWHTDPMERAPLHDDTLAVAEHCILPYVKAKWHLNVPASLRGEAISAIIEAMFREPSPFKERQPFRFLNVSSSICYYAEIARDYVLRILPPSARIQISFNEVVERQRGGGASSPAGLPAAGSRSNQAEHHHHLMARRQALRECFRTALGEPGGSKALALFLLSDAAGYSWPDIGCWLGLPPGTTAKDDTPAGTGAPDREPSHVAEHIWNEVRQGWELPEGAAIRDWFPPPPTVNALSTFYSRALARVRRQCKMC